MNSATMQLESPLHSSKLSPPKKKLRSSFNSSFRDKDPSHEVQSLVTPAPLERRLENTSPLSSNDRKRTNKSGTLQDEENLENTVVSSGSKKTKQSDRCDPSPETKTSVTRPSTSSDRKKATRRSTRRSSFITGRISKSFTVKAPDIFEDISPDLPQDKRLELLHSKALENVLDNMEESLPDLTNFAEFRIKAMDSAETVINSLRECGDFIKATAPPETLINNTESQTLEENIRQTEAEIKRFNEESEKWDQILAEYKQLAEEAERLQQSIKDTSSETVTPPPTPALLKSQQAILDDRIDVKALYSQLKTICEKQVLCVDAVSHRVKLQTEVFREAERVVQTQAHRIASQSFPDLKQDPKELIQNVTTDKDCNSTSGGAS